MTNPTFGEKEANVEYVTRYGVYAVIPDEKKEKIILVQAPNGAWFLPGGEIEEGENHQTALGRYLGQADEYFYSRHRDTHFYNPAYLYEVTSFQEVQKPLEDFNQLAWFPVEEAIETLKRGSHKWGIQAWKNTLKA